MSSDRPEKERRPSAKVLLCKDFTRGRCSRNDCRFAHTSNTNGIERTDEGEMVTVCNDFLRARCARGAACRYFHPPAHLVGSLATKVGITPAPDGPLVDLPPYAGMAPSIAEMYTPAPPAYLAYPPMAPPARMFTRPALEVCRDFLKGRCTRDSSACRYAHTQPSEGEGSRVTVCQDFLKNRCERSTCRFFHPDEHLKAQIQDVPVHRAPPSFPSADVDPMAAYYSAYAMQGGYQAQGGGYQTQFPTKRMRVDDLMCAPGVGGAAMGGGEDERARKTSLEMQLPYYTLPSLPYASLPMSPYLHQQLVPAHAAGAAAAAAARPPSSQDRLSVCRDFMNSKCSRPACRYVHPDEKVQVVDGHVTLCRDAVKNRCERDACRFYHPKQAEKVE